MAWWHDVARKNHPSRMLRDAVDEARAGSDLRKLSTVDLGVLGMLVQYSDWDTGRNAFPGIARLGRLTASHPKTVENSLRRLVRYGFITRVGRGHRGSAAVYEINLDHIENGAGTSGDESANE